MARRQVFVRATGQLVRGSMDVSFELEDEKGNWLPLATERGEASHSGFTATAQIGDLLALDTFDKAVKTLISDRATTTDRILAAQAKAETTHSEPADATQLPLNLDVAGGNYTDEYGAAVIVTAVGMPSKEQLQARHPVTEATPDPVWPPVPADAETKPPKRAVSPKAKDDEAGAGAGAGENGVSAVGGEGAAAEAGD